MWMSALILVLLFSIPFPAAAQQTDRTKVTNTTVSCGAASATALAATDNINFILFVNDHATQVIYLANDGTTAGPTATLNNGIRVNAAGGAVMFDVKVPIGGWTCIASGAATPLLISAGTK
jgi:hypothetical protein